MTVFLGTLYAYIIGAVCGLVSEKDGDVDRSNVSVLTNALLVLKSQLLLRHSEELLIQ